MEEKLWRERYKGGMPASWNTGTFFDHLIKPREGGKRGERTGGNEPGRAHFPRPGAWWEEGLTEKHSPAAPLLPPRGQDEA